MTALWGLAIQVLRMTALWGACHTTAWICRKQEKIEKVTGSERSRPVPACRGGICSSADLSWKWFSTEGSGGFLALTHLFQTPIQGIPDTIASIWHEKRIGPVPLVTPSRLLFLWFVPKDTFE